MQVKIYVPQTIEIPSEYVPALAQRALENPIHGGGEMPATRGHLVRQAVLDGLLRQFDSLVEGNDVVDLFCDPSAEMPLEIENRTLTLKELLDCLQNRPAAASNKQGIDKLKTAVIPKRVAA